MCLNDLDDDGKKIDMKLFGPDEGRGHRRVDLNYLPCKPKQLTKDNEKDYDTKCLADLKSKESTDKKLKEILEYVGSPVYTMVYNTQRQNLTNYGEDSIENEAQVLYKQFDISKPNFFMG